MKCACERDHALVCPCGHAGVSSAQWELRGGDAQRACCLLWPVSCENIHIFNFLSYCADLWVCVSHMRRRRKKMRMKMHRRLEVFFYYPNRPMCFQFQFVLLPRTFTLSVVFLSFYRFPCFSSLLPPLCLLPVPSHLLSPAARALGMSLSALMVCQQVIFNLSLAGRRIGIFVFVFPCKR